MAAGLSLQMKRNPLGANAPTVRIAWCPTVAPGRDANPPKGVSILLLIMLTMLYGTVELGGRRAGFVIMLLGGAAAASMPFLHGMGPQATRWGFFFVWTLLALGVSGAFTAILAVRALWRSVGTRANGSPSDPIRLAARLARSRR